MARISLGGRLSAALTATALVALAACSDVPDPSSPAIAPDAPSLAKGQAEDDVVPGEVIVKFRDGADIDAVGRANGLRRGVQGYAHAFDIMHTTVGNERAMAARLSADPNVEYAEPNYIRHADAIDSRLWAFYNPGGLRMSYTSGGTGFIGSSYSSVADADEDNTTTFTATNVVTIGSIDTGVDFTHPEFGNRLIAGKDWYSNDNDPSDTPDEGHGTHTTGTAAGANVGVAGVAGVSASVKIYVQRVCGPVGCYSSAIVNAINAAAAYRDAAGKPLVAVNFSIGGNSESTAEKTAIQKLTDAGVLFIASAGNSGSGKVACPACDPNAISVAATNWKDELAAYSQSGTGLDIAAPGGYCYSNTTPEGCIFSAVASGWTEGNIESGPMSGAYGYMMGTSMAAPQVTGTAAVVSAVTGLRGSALRNRILSTADDKGQPGYDNKFGNGRLNTYRAVMGASAGQEGSLVP